MALKPKFVGSSEKIGCIPIGMIRPTAWWICLEWGSKVYVWNRRPATELMHFERTAEEYIASQATSTANIRHP